ncbi:MAG: hypothetical protein JSV59_05210 [Flavobacteriaceae bacterium]|nr:MAG: hypothetical protein JSV59_05210 [Flavobacteriaceae bacterium]
MKQLKIFQFVSFLALFALVFQVQAQHIDLSVDYGYQFGTKLKYGGNYLKAGDGGYLTASLGIETAPDLMAEVTYMRMDTELFIRDFVISPNEQRLADLTMDWIQLGATNYFSTAGEMTPFFGGTAGVVILSPNNENADITTRRLNSTTEFAFSFKGGVIFNVSDVVGIKIQGDLLFPVSWGGVYVGGGPGGIGGGVAVSSTTIMGGLKGGLVFTLD